MNRPAVNPQAPIEFLPTSLSWQHPADSEIEIAMHSIYDDEADSDYPIELSTTGRGRDKGTTEMTPDDAILLGRALIACAERFRAITKERAALNAVQFKDAPAEAKPPKGARP